MVRLIHQLNNRPTDWPTNQPSNRLIIIDWLIAHAFTFPLPAWSICQWLDGPDGLIDKLLKLRFKIYVQVYINILNKLIIQLK